MSSSGHRYPLLLYVLILKRWWRILLGIGIVLLILAFGFRYLPGLLPAIVSYDVSLDQLRMIGLAGIGAICLALFLMAIRKFAYVQPFENHLRLATPFLRLKIAYRRIRQTACMEMGRVFPPAQLKRKRRLLKPLAKLTLVVLDLNGLPLSRSALKLFLSPLFFPDKTARLALLVPDWMEFSNELESFRSAWTDAQRQTERDPRMALFSTFTENG